MSIELESGLVVKSLDPRLLGKHLVRLSNPEGNDVVLGLAEATHQLEEIFDLPEMMEDRGVRKIMPVLLSFKPTLVEDDFVSFGGNIQFTPKEYLRPFIQVEAATLADFGTTPINFMGQQVSPIDFLFLTHYILSNTALEGPGDPRLDLLERLRSKYGDPTQ